MDNKGDVDFLHEPHRFSFHPYGLTSWARASWLDNFQVQPGGDVDYIWLGYADTVLPDFDPRQFLLCGTFYACGNHENRDLESAKSAGHLLANLMLPKITVDRPQGFMERLFSYVNSQAQQYETWPEFHFPVNQVKTKFRRWDFADGTAAFASLDDQTGVAIVSEGISIDRLEIGTQGDLFQYGVNASEGVRFSDVSRGTLIPSRDDFHSDFHPFLGLA